MKTITLIIALIMAGLSLAAQPQPKGEYHTYILKKTDAERRKTKNQEWWNKGVIMFAKQDIVRLGKIKEVEPLLQSEFTPNDKFVGRVYLWNSIGEMDPKPSMIFYHLFIDGKKAETKVVTKEGNLPDKEWSSWMIDFPEYFEAEWPAIAPGKHLCRVECWAAYSVDETTVFVDDNDKILASHTEKKGKIKFLASGEFTWLNGEEEEAAVETESETTEVEHEEEETTEVESETETEAHTEAEKTNVPAVPAPKTTPANWKEEWYKKNPVYKKPAKECDCKEAGCAELESIETKTTTAGKITTIRCVVENQGAIASCETNAVLRIMWMEEEKGKDFLHIEQKLPAIAAKSKTTVVFTIENFWFNADEQVIHFIMDYDGNVAETEEMNLAPVNVE
jgi:hypothetical protein